MADDRARPGDDATSGRLPGDALLHPVSLAALALLLVNDHVLKAAFPGPVTGKLSDVAGAVLFPLILWSATELALALGGRWRGPSARALAAAVTASTAILIAIKTVPAAALGAGWVLGLAQWSLTLPLRLLTDAPLPAVAPALIVADPTDLLAVPTVVLAIWVGRSRLATRRTASVAPSPVAPAADPAAVVG